MPVQIINSISYSQIHTHKTHTSFNQPHGTVIRNMGSEVSSTCELQDLGQINIQSEPSSRSVKTGSAPSQRAVVRAE